MSTCKLTNTIGNYIHVSETNARENPKTRTSAGIRGKPREKILFTLESSRIGEKC
jgi:hypothetical protein